MAALLADKRLFVTEIKGREFGNKSAIVSNELINNLVIKKIFNTENTKRCIN
jgi:hypothetical protein